MILELIWSKEGESNTLQERFVFILSVSAQLRVGGLCVLLARTMVLADSIWANLIRSCSSYNLCKAGKSTLSIGLWRSRWQRSIIEGVFSKTMPHCPILGHWLACSCPRKVRHQPSQWFLHKLDSTQRNCDRPWQRMQPRCMPKPPQ